MHERRENNFLEKGNAAERAQWAKQRGNVGTTVEKCPHNLCG